MTKRIFLGSLVVALVAIVASLALSLSAIYNSMRKTTVMQLSEEAELLSITLTGGEDYERFSSMENRITIVAEDGTVIFDNVADENNMENHNDREEIIAARKNGNATVTRISSTLSENTIYCARELEDGRVVRVSCSQDTPFSMLLSLWWEILLVVIAAVIISAILATAVAKKIVKPINEIDLKEPDIDESYTEIAPLLHRLNEQNKEISAKIEELSRSRTEFALITENMSEGFIIADRHTEILSYNTAALNILGADNVAEKQSVLTLNRSPNFLEAIESALKGDRCERTLEISEKTYGVIANPVRTDGGITGAVIIIFDTTEREQRDRLRREFTSNVSHELKTPLTSIYGISDMICGGIVKPEDIGGFAKNIRDESGRLITLIEDIIKLSQLDENNFTDRRERVNIAELARLAVSRLSSIADRSGITLTVSGDEAVYEGIPSVLEEMIYNLLDNAVKYNKAGGKAEINIKDGDNVVITVKDTGIGIPSDSIDRVFERFFRADKSHSRRIGGTGLGLSIVKHGAQLHGGSVSAESAEGIGTTMTLVLPRRTENK